MVTPEEQRQIQERMTQVGILNMGAYMRKMALNGYVLQVDLLPHLSALRNLLPPLIHAEKCLARTLTAALAAGLAVLPEPLPPV